MSASDAAFLALGLLLGIAAGAALIVVLRNRAPSREIRLTVTRDAVPRRSATLSADAFLANPGEPGPGGPGDRRLVERSATSGEPLRRATDGLNVPSSAGRTPTGGPGGRGSRTPVLFAGPATAIAIEPELDHALEALRARRPASPLIDRMLRGDHTAMLDVIDAVAGADGQRRREWEVLLAALADALVERSIELGVLDFPMGAPFWDAFTIEQCRGIAGALASMGYRFDGRGGWESSRQPTYRDLGQAVADVGVEPRRIRAWPSPLEVAALFQGVRAAPEDLIQDRAPTLDLADLRQLLGVRAEPLDNLWLTWETVRPLLLAGGPELASP